MKLKNLQWQKLDAKTVEKTIWHVENRDHDSMEEILNEKGAFGKIEELFPAKVNTFLENRRIKQNNATEKNDSVRFLNREKNKNISKLKQLTSNLLKRF